MGDLCELARGSAFESGPNVEATCCFVPDSFESIRKFSGLGKPAAMGALLQRFDEKKTPLMVGAVCGACFLWGMLASTLL